MGTIMKEDDVFIDSLLDLLNLRFAPSQGGAETEWFGGLDEMVALQREFQIFKAGRPFAVSVAALNLGNLLNPRAKNRWNALLEDLRSYSSNAGENADADIVKAIVENLEASAPLPVYFVAHDSGPGGDAKRVRIEGRARPVFYLRQDYLTISLPMKAREK